MKKNYLLLSFICILFTNFMIGQVAPAINETSKININDVNDVNAKIVLIQDQSKVKMSEFANNITANWKIVRNTSSSIEIRTKATDDIEKDSVQYKYFKDNLNSSSYDVLYKEIIKKSLINPFFPTRNSSSKKYFKNIFYNQQTENTSYLTNLSYNFNKDVSITQSDLASDFIKWFRISFGTVITTSSIKSNTDTPQQITQSAALNQFVNGGGNVYLDLTLPIVAYRSDWFTIYSYENTRGAVDIKGFGNDIDSSTYNISEGLNLYASCSSDDRKFNFFLYGSYKYTLGSTEFYQNLNLSENKPFSLGKISAGLTILNKIRVTALFNTFGSDQSIKTNKILFGIQILQGVLSGNGSTQSGSSTIANTASPASSVQVLKVCTPLTPIMHITTGATGIGLATGLPNGVTPTWVGNIITITGTPTESGTFKYNIPLTGGVGAVNATGNITVTSTNKVEAASSAPTLCINTALTAITHNTTGATGIGATTGLPTGVTAVWAGNIITITGTPTTSGNFKYTIPLTGVGCEQLNATGTIIVTPNNTVSNGSINPTLSINTVLTAITHTTTGATGIGTAAGLPKGVTAAWKNNTITISGQPTEQGTFNYSIPLIGGCGTANASGTIIVNP